MTIRDLLELTVALLVVNLPADAQVFVNGSKTSATGASRRLHGSARARRTRP